MGGEPGIIKLVEVVLAAELADAEIGSDFRTKHQADAGAPEFASDTGVHGAPTCYRAGRTGLDVPRARERRILVAT